MSPGCAVQKRVWPLCGSSSHLVPKWPSTAAALMPPSAPQCLGMLGRQLLDRHASCCAGLAVVVLSLTSTSQFSQCCACSNAPPASMEGHYLPPFI